MSKNRSSSSYDESAQGQSPSADPPQQAGGGGGAGAGDTRPSKEPPSSVSESAGAAGAGGSAPSFIPEGGGTKSEGITAWQNDKRITGLWTINETRNSWVYVTGVGWKKLSTSNDSATVALTMLGGSARQTNTPVNYRDEADGMIHEMYVW
jgi:hypothetical protein